MLLGLVHLSRLRKVVSQIAYACGFLSLPLVGRVGERKRAGGGVSRNHFHPGSLEEATAPTRPSLRAGHPPHAFRGGGIIASWPTFPSIHRAAAGFLQEFVDQG